MKLIIVSGLSGSGKSVVLHSLEDLGFYCIDNLPLSLLKEFASQISRSELGHYEHAAVGVDARNLTEDFENFAELLSQVCEMGFDCEVVFLQADDATLIKRFSETRRKHPLTHSGISLAEAISLERKLLSAVAISADWCIDTTHTNVHQLRDLIRERMLSEARTMSLTFLSFGFKHGVPVDTDFVFDVRCLPNPHWEPQLRALTGLDAEVQLFLAKQPTVNDMYSSIEGFIEKWLPCFQADNRSYMTVAIGCTGGQHRSVYMAKRLSDHFSGSEFDVLLRHRELL
ncbi:RNase adapter RapZ [Pseudomonadota bacterium]